MANHISHAALPYPVKNARFTVLVPYLDADGDPTDPTTPDTEFSLDAAGFGDTAEEVTTITGSNGIGYLTLTGAETNGSVLAVACKVASGPKATLMTLYPRVLPVVESGTAQAGANGSITLAAAASDVDLTGCIVKTTGGTGGGGTGGLANQARMITAYDVITKVATVVPNWETNPANNTTYEILMTEMAVNNIRHFPQGVARGVCTTGGSTTSIVTSSIAPAAAATDQFKGRIVIFDRNTTTANLRGQATDITASTAGGVLTVTALSHAPVSGDTFIIC